MQLKTNTPSPREAVAVAEALKLAHVPGGTGTHKEDGGDKDLFGNLWSRGDTRTGPESSAEGAESSAGGPESPAGGGGSLSRLVLGFLSGTVCVT